MTAIVNPNSDQKNADPRESPRFVISMDLGSDSTVVYVQAPNKAQPVKIDLQHFMNALAIEPAFYLDEKGQPSHRLRSRYSWNEAYKVDGALTTHEDTTGHEEILPPGHAKTLLIDFEKYSDQRNPHETNQNCTDCAINGRQVAFKFIDSYQTRFPLEDLLPNAKLVFQSGMRPLRFKAEFETSNGPKIESYRITPLELIANQVCLILENFVRHHPVMSPGGDLAEWRDCAVVLTVPNTYSPFHRENLSTAVAAKLGCTVKTITESDAIVFHYYSSQPNRDIKSLEEEARLVQQYITLDIGKGTTDLTLMYVSRKQASSEDLEARGLERKDARLPHFYIQARTGRPSGGAKLTFIVARHLESLIDLAVKRAMTNLHNQTLVASGPPAPPGSQRPTPKPPCPITASPVRFTTRNPSDIRDVFLTRDSRILLEGISEEHKRGIDVVVHPDRQHLKFTRLADPKPAQRIGDALAKFLMGVFDPAATAFPGPDPAATDYEAAMAASPLGLATRHISDSIAQALNDPDSFRRSVALAAGDDHEDLQARWMSFQRQVDAYVKENVDTVLIELARAHYDKVMEIDPKDGAEALRDILQKDSRIMKRSKLSPELQLRTHLIIAGQGSQFKPIMLRLRQIVSQTHLRDMLDETGTPVHVVPEVAEKSPSGPAKTSKVASLLGGAKGLGDRFKRGSGYEPVRAQPQDRAVPLNREFLKDGCAHGALLWWIADPVIENAHYIQGQLAASPAMGGAGVQWVDMDRLNTDGAYPLSGGQDPSAWNIYYLPSKGQRREHPHDLGAPVIGRIPLCDSFTFELASSMDQPSHVMIRVRGKVVPLEDGALGNPDPEESRALFWPGEVPT